MVDALEILLTDFYFFSHLYLLIVQKYNVNAFSILPIHDASMDVLYGLCLMLLSLTECCFLW